MRDVCAGGKLLTWHMTAALRLIGDFIADEALLRVFGERQCYVRFQLSRSDRCTAEDGEADTYKVVGYVRLRVRVSTGCEEDFDEDPPMGRLLVDPLEFAGKRDDAEPRITRMGIGKVGERGIWLKQKKQLH